MYVCSASQPEGMIAFLFCLAYREQPGCAVLRREAPRREAEVPATTFPLPRPQVTATPISFFASSFASCLASQAVSTPEATCHTSNYIGARSLIGRSTSGVRRHCSSCWPKHGGNILFEEDSRHARGCRREQHEQHGQEEEHRPYHPHHRHHHPAPLRLKTYNTPGTRY